MNTTFLLLGLLTGIFTINHVYAFWNNQSPGFLKFDGNIGLQRCMRILTIILGLAYIIGGSIVICDETSGIDCFGYILVWCGISVATYFFGFLAAFILLLIYELFKMAIRWTWYDNENESDSDRELDADE